MLPNHWTENFQLSIPWTGNYGDKLHELAFMSRTLAPLALLTLASSGSSATATKSDSRARIPSYYRHYLTM